MRHQKALLVVWLLLLANVSQLRAFFFWECDGQKLRWNPASITLRASSVSFPSGSAFTMTYASAVTQWNLNPSNLSILLRLNEPSVAIDNGESETWFSNDPFLITGRRGVTFTQIDCGSHRITEADVVFNVNEPLSTSQLKQNLLLYTGTRTPFDALAIHELGHAVGLDHETRTYTIMFDLTHLHTNGNSAIAYPGEDAINGAIFLHGLNATKREDVAVSHWKVFIHEELGSLQHVRTVIWDREPGEGWTQPVNAVEDDFVWPAGDPRWEVYSGQQIWPEFTFENNGASRQDGVSVNYYISNDDFISTADRLFANRSVNLGRDWPFSYAHSITLPADLTENTFYSLGVIVDRNNIISETLQEGNNATYTRIKIMPTYPLSVTFSPTHVEPGEPSTCTVRLIGAAPAGGTTVSLRSLSPYLTLPATLAFAAGSMSASFVVTAGPAPNLNSFHEANMYANRIGVPHTQYGLLYIGTMLPPEGDRCRNNISVICRLCDQIPLPQCGPMFDFDFRIPPWKFPPPPPEPPWIPPYEFLPVPDDRMSKVYPALEQVVLLKDFESQTGKELESVRNAFSNVPAGYYFSQEERASLLKSLTDAKTLNAKLTFDLMRAANAAEMDNRVPGPLARKAEGNQQASFNFGDYVRVSMNHVDSKKDGQPKLNLSFSEGLPTASSQFKGVWPLMTYRLHVDADFDYADVTFSLRGLVQGSEMQELKIYEWNGVNYNELPSFVDTRRGLVSTRVSTLGEYVIGKIKDNRRMETKK